MMMMIHGDGDDDENDAGDDDDYEDDDDDDDGGVAGDESMPQRTILPRSRRTLMFNLFFREMSCKFFRPRGCTTCCCLARPGALKKHIL